MIRRAQRDAGSSRTTVRTKRVDTPWSLFDRPVSERARISPPHRARLIECARALAVYDDVATFAYALCRPPASLATITLEFGIFRRYVIHAILYQIKRRVHQHLSCVDDAKGNPHARFARIPAYRCQDRRVLEGIDKRKGIPIVEICDRDDVALVQRGVVERGTLCDLDKSDRCRRRPKLDVLLASSAKSSRLHALGRGHLAICQRHGGSTRWIAHLDVFGDGGALAMDDADLILGIGSKSGAIIRTIERRELPPAWKLHADGSTFSERDVRRVGP